MTRRERTPLARIAEAAFYAPIGLGAILVEDFPATVAKARQQITLARFVGKMAVDHGTKQVRDGLAKEPGATSVSAPTTASEPPGAPAQAADQPVDVADLALPDYDQLPAAHIVGKLDGLTQVERDEIEVYEQAGRHRRTVLGKLDQLRVR